MVWRQTIRFPSCTFSFFVFSKAMKAASPRSGDGSSPSSAHWSVAFTIESGDWTDTGVMVTPADHLNFTATGTLTMADGRPAPPDGVTRGWRDMIRIFPLNSANSGALIGRIGNQDAAVPFLIGASKDMDISATGHLYLRLNLSSDLSGTGSIAVKMKLTKAGIKLLGKQGSLKIAVLVTITIPGQKKIVEHRQVTVVLKKAKKKRVAA